MILLTVYVAISSQPPLGEALYRTVWPSTIDAMKIVALVGGTVGGYISFAGAHRLLDAGIKGKTHLPEVTRSSVTGILLTCIMRYTLFLAALGVVFAGSQLDLKNPAASVFRIAAGEIGYKFFGVVMWSAAITSVIGASYTSVSFWKTFNPRFEKNEKWLITGFIIISTLIFILLKQTPSFILVTAGAINGIILPMALAVMLLAVMQKRLFPNYKHPLWMYITGWVVVGLMSWLSVITIKNSL
jgi:Mn2+/Fe2+ NRAMP family transporter